MPENILGAKNEELNRQRMHLEAERRAIGASRPKALDIDQLAANTFPKPLPGCENGLRRGLRAISS